MAKKIDWQNGAIDAAIAVGGGTIIVDMLLPKIPMVGDLVAKLPADVMGISVPVLIAGAVALIAYRYFK